MRLTALILVATLFAGCEAIKVETLPEGVSAADVALFKSAVTDAGCAIETPAQAVPITTQTGFEREKLALIAQYLVLAGESVPTATGFRLISGPCANA